MYSTNTIDVEKWFYVKVLNFKITFQIIKYTFFAIIFVHLFTIPLYIISYCTHTHK